MRIIKWLRFLKSKLRRHLRRRSITVKMLSSTRFSQSHSAVLISFPAGKNSLSIRSTAHGPKPANQAKGSQLVPRKTAGL
jgi:hypothetical protein